MTYDPNSCIYELHQIHLDNLYAEIFDNRRHRNRRVNFQVQLENLWDEDVARYSDGINQLLFNLINQRIMGQRTAAESVWED